MPNPWFMTSITASVALRTLGKWTAATVVGRTGASLIVTVSRCQVGYHNFLNDTSLPSVTMPRVPSAPMNSFVVSNPADDLRDLRRVLMTSPDGRTTVCVARELNVAM